MSVDARGGLDAALAEAARYGYGGPLAPVTRLRATLLPRRVTLAGGDLALVAAQGAILSCSGPGTEGLAGRALGPADAPELSARLAGVTSPARPHAAPLDAPPDPLETGVPVAALLAARDDRHPADRLATASPAEVLAAYTPEGEVRVFHDGWDLDEAALDRLDLAFAALGDRLAEGDCLVLDGPSAALAVIREGGALAGLVLAPGSGPRIAALWTAGG